MIQSKLKADRLAYIDEFDNEFTVLHMIKNGISVSSKNELKRALSKFSSDSGTIIVVDEINIDEDITVPENICLVVLQSGLFNVSSGKTLTINGRIKAGLQQVFTGEGIVDVSKATKSIVIVKTVQELVSKTKDQTNFVCNVKVLGYHEEGDGGGGFFYWNSEEDKTNHNGGTVIDPLRPFPTDWDDLTQQESWFTAGSSGNGCWVRLYDNQISVKWFGAKGDWFTNDTKSLQTVLDVSRNIYVPEGTYRIDPAVGLDVHSHTTIVFDSNTLIKNLSHDLTEYEMVRLHDVEDVSITNINIDGNRASNSATFGESGYGLSVRGSTKIRLYSPTCKNCWGDGIYIGSTDTQPYCEDVIVYDPLCDNNRRFGIRLVSGKHVYLVRPRLMNSNGVSPESGLGFEPESNNDFLEGIWVTEPYTSENSGVGILASLNALVDSSKIVSICVINHIDSGSTVAFQISNIQGTLTGHIVFQNPIWTDSYTSAFRAQNIGVTGPKVEIIRPKVVNPNRSGGTNSKTDSAFTIFSELGDPGTTRLGNVHIYEPEVIVTSGSEPTHTLFVRDERDTVDLLPTSISFVNPRSISHQSDKNALYLDLESPIIRDDYGVLVYESDSTSSYTLTHGNYQRTITNRLSTADITVTLEKFAKGFEITFECWGTHYLTIDPDDTDIILPLTSATGKYIQSNEKGAKVTLRKVDEDTWFVTEMVGTWEVES